MKIQRKWRRAWRRGEPLYLARFRKHTSVRKQRPKLRLLRSEKAYKTVAAGLSAFAILDPLGLNIAAAAANNIVTDGQTKTTVAANGNITNITTNTVAGANGFNSFQYFNVNTGNTVNLQLPKNTANLLNFVTGGQQSNIYGILNSIKDGKIGGNVYFLNPQGMMVGAGGSVNVGSLTVFTPTKAFMNSVYNSALQQYDPAAVQEILAHSLQNAYVPIDSNGSIVVKGKINAMNDIKMYAGNVTVDKDTDTAGNVVSRGEIKNGAVFTATAPGFSDMVNTNGASRGTTLQNVNGNIEIVADGQIINNGTIANLTGTPGKTGVKTHDVTIKGKDIQLNEGSVVSARGYGSDSSGGAVTVKGTQSAVFNKGAVIDARGGEKSGDGGAIDFSANDSVKLAGGSFQAGAVKGEAGSVLVDPYGLEISESFNSDADFTAQAKAITVDSGVTIDAYGHDINLIASIHDFNDNGGAAFITMNNATLQGKNITLSATSAISSNSSGINTLGASAKIDVLDSTIQAAGSLKMTAASNLTMTNQPTAQIPANSCGDAAAAISNGNSTASVHVGSSKTGSTTVSAGGGMTLSAVNSVNVTTTADASGKTAGASTALSKISSTTQAYVDGNVTIANTPAASITATSGNTVTTVAKATTQGAAQDASGTSQSAQELKDYESDASTTDGKVTAAAALAINDITNTTQAYLASTSTATTPVFANGVQISSNAVNKSHVTADGSSVKSGATGVGVAVGINKVTSDNEAYVNQKIKANGLKVTAQVDDANTPTAKNQLTTTVTSGAGDAGKVGVAGALGVNLANLSSAAQIKKNVDGDGGNITLQAVNDSDSTVTVSGGSSGGSVGIGASAAMNIVKQNSAQAQIINDADITNANNISVQASGVHTLDTEATAGAAGGIAVSPVVALTAGDNSAEASIGTGSILTAGSLNVDATNSDTITTAATGSTDSSKAAVGAALAINVVNDTATATTDRDITTSGAVTLNAQNVDNITANATASASGGKAAKDDGTAESGQQNVDEMVSSQTSFGQTKQGKKQSEQKSATSASTSEGKLSAAAAVGVNVTDSETTAKTKAGHTITTGGKLTVKSAQNASDTVKADGSAVESADLGIGAAAAINTATINNLATLEKGTYNVTGLDVEAAAYNNGTSNRSLFDADATSGAGGSKISVAGSLALNVVNDISKATISSGANVPANGGDVTITAENISGTNAKATHANEGASDSKLGVGASVAITIETNDTEAWVGDNATVTGTGNSKVAATADEKLSNSAAGGAGGGAVGVAGSVTEETLSLTTKAYIGQAATIAAGQNVAVEATDTTTAKDYAGALADGTKVGISAGVDVGTIQKDTEAYIGSSAKVNSGNNVDIKAVSGENITSDAAGLAGGGSAGIAGAGAGYSLTDITKAYIANGTPTETTLLTAGGSLWLDADSNTTLNMVQNMAGIADTISFCAGAGVAVVNKTTKSFIGTETIGAGTTSLDASNTSVTALGSGTAGGLTVDDGSFNASYGQYASDENPVSLQDTTTDKKGNAQKTSIGTAKDTSGDQALSEKRSVHKGTTFWHGLAVTATNQDDIRTFAVGGGVAADGAVALSGGVNVISNTTNAQIGDKAKINQDNDSGADAQQSVRVAAGNDLYYIGVAGSLAGGSVAGVGAGANVTVITDRTDSSIGQSAQVKARNSLTVNAQDGQQLISLAANASIAGETAVAGAASVFYLDNATQATIGDSATVYTGGNTLVNAIDTTGTDLIAGDAAVGFGTAGVGGAVGVTYIKKDTQATVGSNATVDVLTDPQQSAVNMQAVDKDDSTKFDNVSGLLVQAQTQENVLTVDAAGAGGFYAGVAGAVSVESLDLTTHAGIGSSAKINTGDGKRTGGSSQSVTVAAHDNTKLTTITGALAGALGAGVAGGVDVGVIKDNTLADIGDGATVNAKQDVDVYALAEKAVNSTTVSASGGLGAIAGGVSVYSIGNGLDSDATSRLSTATTYKTKDSSKKKNDPTVSSADQYADNEATNSSVTDLLGKYNSGSMSGISSSAATSRNSSKTSSTLSYDTKVSKGTIAHIGAGANIHAGSKVTVQASDKINKLNITTGIASVGGVGLGAGVGVATVSDVVKAYADDNTQISANSTGSVNFAAIMDETAADKAYVGSGGIIAADAAVAVLKDQSQVEANVGNQTAIHDAKTISITTSDSRHLTAETVGAGVGVDSAGAAVAKVTLAGSDKAYTGNDVQLGLPSITSGSSTTDQILIEGSADLKADSTSEAANGGIGLAASGSVADATVATTVDAYTGKTTVTTGGSQLVTTGNTLHDSAGNTIDNVIIKASATPIAKATAKGIDIGALEVGVSQATASAKPTVDAYLGQQTTVNTNNIAITALVQTPGNDDFVYASAVASGGGLIGVNATSASASNEATVDSYIDDGSNLKISGQAVILAQTETRQHAEASGKNGGIVAVGANTATAQSNSKTNAYLGLGTKVNTSDTVNGTLGTPLMGQLLKIDAEGTDDNYAVSTAGAGGVVTGAAATAITTTTSVTNAYVEDDTQVGEMYDTTKYDASLNTVYVPVYSIKTVEIDSNHTSKFNSSVNTLSAGVVGMSGAKATHTETSDVTARISKQAAINVPDEVKLAAKDTVVKDWLGDFSNFDTGKYKDKGDAADWNIAAGSGGLAGAAAVQDNITVTSKAIAEVGDQADIHAGSDPAGTDCFTADAGSNIIVHDKSKINAGEAISQASDQTSLTVTSTNTVNFGANAKINSLYGKIKAGARGDADLDDRVAVDVFGGVSVAPSGQANVSYTGKNQLEVKQNASLTTDMDDIFLAAGQDSSGNSGTINDYADIHIWDNTIVPIDVTPNPRADITNDASIAIDDAADVASAQDLYLIATKGQLNANYSGVGKNTYSDLASLIGVSLELDGGSASAAGTGSVVVNGTAETGRNRNLSLDIGQGSYTPPPSEIAYDSDGNVIDPQIQWTNKYTRDSSNKTDKIIYHETQTTVLTSMTERLNNLQKLRAEYATDPVATGAYDAEIKFLETKMVAMGLGYWMTNPDTTQSFVACVPASSSQSPREIAQAYKNTMQTAQVKLQPVQNTVSAIKTRDIDQGVLDTDNATLQTASRDLDTLGITDKTTAHLNSIIADGSTLQTTKDKCTAYLTAAAAATFAQNRVDADKRNIQTNDTQITDTSISLSDYIKSQGFLSTDAYNALNTTITNVVNLYTDDYINSLSTTPEDSSSKINSVTIDNVMAKLGNIKVTADNLTIGGSGKLSAPGDASIKITNSTPSYLTVNDLTIRDGGNILINGGAAYTLPDIDKYNKTKGLNSGDHASQVVTKKNSDAPVISISNTFDPSQYTYNIRDTNGNTETCDVYAAPDITLNGTIANLDGIVSIASKAGSIYSNGSIYAGTVDITATNGDFVQSYVEGFDNIGGDPSYIYNNRNNSDLKIKGIVANGNVFISARYLNINGLIQSGIADWTVTIPQDATLTATAAQLGLPTPDKLVLFCNVQNEDHMRWITIPVYYDYSSQKYLFGASSTSGITYDELREDYPDQILPPPKSGPLTYKTANGNIATYNWDTNKYEFNTAFAEDISKTLSPGSSRFALSSTTDNIPVDYDGTSHEYVVEETAVHGGTVQLYGQIINTAQDGASTGKIKALDGYGSIAITNNSDKAVVVNNLSTGDGTAGVIDITDIQSVSPDGKTVTAKHTVYTSKDGVLTEKVDGQTVPVSSPTTITNQDGSTRQGTTYQPQESLYYTWTTGTDTSITTTYYYKTKKLLGWKFSDHLEGDVTGISMGVETPLDGGIYLSNSRPYDGSTTGTVIDNYSSDGYHSGITIQESNGTPQYQKLQEWTTSSWLGLVKTYHQIYEITKPMKNITINTVSASNPIGIEFIGSNSGTVKITSNTNIGLTGSISNSAGATTIHAGSGDISQNAGALITTKTLDMSGATIGTSDQAIRTENVDTLTAVANATNTQTAVADTGNIYVNQIIGGIGLKQVTADKGIVNIVADGSITGVNAATNDSGGNKSVVRAKRIELTSNNGSIGTSDSNGALQIAAGDTSSILAADKKQYGLKASAMDGIYIKNNQDTSNNQYDGNLLVDTVVSAIGDVTLSTAGQMIDNNLEEQIDSHTYNQLLNYWNSLQLTGSAAEDKLTDAVTAYEHRKTADYQTYWQLKTHIDGNGKYQLTDAETAWLNAQNQDITAYVQSQADKYDALKTEGVDKWNHASGTFDSTWTYTVKKGSDEYNQLAKGHSWTDTQLAVSVSSGTLKQLTDTNPVIKAPNVKGKHVQLNADKGIGSEVTLNISADAIKNPLNNTTSSIVLTDDQRVALAAAERDDIKINADGSIQVLQRKPVNVAVGSDGYLLATAKADYAYLASEGSVPLETINAQGPVRLKVSGGIENAWTDSTANIISNGHNVVLEAADGSIGTMTNPVRLDLSGQGILTARADGSIYITDKYTGSGANENLKIDNIYSKHDVNLDAAGSILAAYTDTVNIEGENLTLTAGNGNIGVASDAKNDTASKYLQVTLEKADSDQPPYELTATAENGDIYLASPGTNDFTIAKVKAHNAYLMSDAGDIQIDAAKGGVTATTVADLYAYKSVFQAAAGTAIAADDIQLEAHTGSIGASNTGGGALQVAATGAVTTAKGAQGVYLTQEGSFIANDVESTAGNISLTATTGNLETGTVTATSGSVTMHAHNNITAGTTTGAAGVSLTADTGDIKATQTRVTGSDAAEGITMTATAGNIETGTVTAAGGSVAMHAHTGITAGMTVGGAGVSLTADTGDIKATETRVTGSDAAEGITMTATAGNIQADTVTAQGGTIILNAGGSITSVGTSGLPDGISGKAGVKMTADNITADDVESTAGDISLTAANVNTKTVKADSGNINLTTTGNLETGTVAAGGSVTMHAHNNITAGTTTGGDGVSLTADSITADDVESTVGDIGLTAANVNTKTVKADSGNINLTTTGNLETGTVTAGGSVTMHAHNNITAGTTTGAAGVSLTADTGDIDTTDVESSAGDITIDSKQGAVGFTHVIAKKGSVVLTAQQGDLKAKTADSAGNIQADVITLTANSGSIGASASPLLIDSSTTTDGVVTAMAAGSVYLQEVNGNFNINQIQSANGGNIDLTAANGSLLNRAQQNGAVNLIGQNITLAAAPGSIGEMGKRFVVEAGGILNASADSDVDLEQHTGNLQSDYIRSTHGSMDLNIPDGKALVTDLSAPNGILQIAAAGGMKIGNLDGSQITLGSPLPDSVIEISRVRVSNGMTINADIINLSSVTGSGSGPLEFSFGGGSQGLAKDITVEVTSPTRIDFTHLAADTATIDAQADTLQFDDITIGSRADINNNLFTVVVNNHYAGTLEGDVELNPGETPFNLYMSTNKYVSTSSRILNYDPSFIVNDFSTDNSYTRVAEKMLVGMTKPLATTGNFVPVPVAAPTTIIGSGVNIGMSLITGAVTGTTSEPSIVPGAGTAAESTPQAGVGVPSAAITAGSTPEASIGGILSGGTGLPAGGIVTSAESAAAGEPGVIGSDDKEKEKDAGSGDGE
ncbi:MAG: leukotoxin LktA family filamentous adhesin [Veillonellales bacterium]